MKYLSILLFLAVSIYCDAQVIPAENAEINHRLTGFSVPKNKAADSYLFEIATDSVNNEKSFKNNIIIKHNDEANRFIETLPEWGKQYTWRVSFLDKKKKVIDRTGLYHFATGYSVNIDTAKYRLRVVSNNAPNKDMLVFIDATMALYDMDGNPVWYVPKTGDVVFRQGAGVRDLKISPQNTVTFLTQTGIYETDYNGKVLWSITRNLARANGKKQDDTAASFHHEFTRLHNGNYMAAGNDRIFFPLPPGTEVKENLLKNPGFKKIGDTIYRKVECGTLTEYDSKGKVKWTWSSANFFSKGDLSARRKTLNGIPDTRTHMNAFYFDEENNYIYISYRDINRIIKIKYPSGEVVTTYGENFVPGEYRQGHGLFNTQHAPRLNADGDLILFNNNVGNHDSLRTSISSILILKEPERARDTLRKIWEFACDFDTLAERNTTSGGNAIELRDKSLLVSMGANNRNFIVSRNKQVLWNAFAENKLTGNKCRKCSSYRAYPIEDKKVLEKLIFSEE